MRQEHHNKKYASHQQTSGKQPEILQRTGVKRQKTQKCAYGGDIAYNQWLRKLFEDIPDRTGILQMRNEMQWIVGRNSHYDRSHPQHNQRNGVTQHTHYTHGENHPEHQCQKDKHKIPPPTERVHQQQHYKHYSDCHRNYAVGLYP